jgi:hypothetical protein
MSSMKSHAEKDDDALEVLGVREEEVESLLTMGCAGILLGAQSGLESAVVDLWPMLSSRVAMAQRVD